MPTGVRPNFAFRPVADEYLKSLVSDFYMFCMVQSMWPDLVSNPGPLTYESGALPIALRGPSTVEVPSIDLLQGSVYDFIPELSGNPLSVAISLRRLPPLYM